MFVKPLHLVTDAMVELVVNKKLDQVGARGMFNPKCLTCYRYVRLDPILVDSIGLRLVCGVTRSGLLKFLYQMV